MNKDFQQNYKLSNKFIVIQRMQTQQIITPISSSNQKTQSKIIDAQKIKSILSKKLSNKIPNPQHMIQQLEQQISYQIEKTQYEIGKQKLRQDKIKLLQQRQLKARSLLNDKIKTKLEKSINKKILQQKQWLQKRLKARKIKQEFIQNKKYQIHQAQLQPRLERFKAIKAQNDPKLQNQVQLPPPRVSLLGRSFSERTSIADVIQKSKELDQIQYFKKLQLLEKRRIYEKIKPQVHYEKAIDKSDWITKLNASSQDKFIQKLGTDLWKIEQARIKKQKQLNTKLQKMKKQSEFKQQQRGYKLQSVKEEMNQRQKSRREVLSKKNERFISMRNKSTGDLLRNSSSYSELRDTFGSTPALGLLKTSSRMSKTLQNFNNSMSLERAKAQDYLVKEREKRMKKEAINVIQKVLKQQKIEHLMR